VPDLTGGKWLPECVSIQCHLECDFCLLTKIASLGLEPTHYSVREAAAILGRSYSWLDRRLRAGQFMLPDGTTVQPLRTPGGYRRFTLAMLKDIALCCYRHRWFTMEKLKSVLRELAIAAYRDTEEPPWSS
jgi:hypothetical protein